MRRASIEWATHSTWSDLSSLRASMHHALADLSFRRWLTRNDLPYRTATIQPLRQPAYEHPVINGNPCFISASCRTLPCRDAFWGQASDIPRHPFPICVEMPTIRRALHICIILIHSHPHALARDHDPENLQPFWLTLIPRHGSLHGKPTCAHLALEVPVPFEGRALVKQKRATFSWLPFKVHAGESCELPSCSAIKALHTSQPPECRVFLRHRDQSIVISPQSWQNFNPDFKEAFFAGWMHQRDVFRFAPGTLMAREWGFRCTVAVPLSQLESPTNLIRNIRQGWG